MVPRAELDGPTLGRHIVSMRDFTFNQTIVLMVPRAELDGPTLGRHIASVRDFTFNQTTVLMVPRAGLEPAQRERRGILNPLCLPIPPPGQRNHAMATPSLLRRLS